jgi:hypothetical protein
MSSLVLLTHVCVCVVQEARMKKVFPPWSQKDDLSSVFGSSASTPLLEKSVCVYSDAYLTLEDYHHIVERLKVGWKHKKLLLGGVAGFTLLVGTMLVLFIYSTSYVSVSRCLFDVRLMPNISFLSCAGNTSRTPSAHSLLCALASSPGQWIDVFALRKIPNQP